MAGSDGDNWVMKITKLLLTEFDGRAKFGKFRQIMYQRNLVKSGMGRVLKRLSSSNRFLLFEKDGRVRYVSVCWKDAQICCGFHKRGLETCKQENCSKFHVCKFFIAGNCAKGSSCRFGHDLENEANANTSHRLGMSSFSPDDIHTIIFRSTPAVCVSHNTGGCRDDHCPDLHMCGLFVQQKCTSGNNCQFGHYLQTSEHNQWVLEAFDLGDFTDEELRKRILVRRVSTADRGLPSHMTPATSSLSIVSCATAASAPSSIATEDSGEYIFSVFSFLLKRYGGRTKFDTFLSERGHIFRSFKRKDIIQWFQDHNDIFLVYKSDGDLKYVSAYNKRASACFKYNDPDGSICDNQSCQFFHICKEFVADICVSSSCRLSHSFSSGPSANMCSDLNLDQFTDTEICKLIRCSSPAVCVNYNISGCLLKDCPDLHVCSKHILKQCRSGNSCEFGHTIKDLGDHNVYVLKAFRMDCWQENVLHKIVMVKRTEHTVTSQPVISSPAPAKPVERQPDENPACCATSCTPSSPKKEVHLPKIDLAPNLSKPERVKDADLGKHEYICETFTWTGVCSKTPNCQRYHSPDRLPYQWLIQNEADGVWTFVSGMNDEIEKLFCDLSDLHIHQFTGTTVFDFSYMSTTDTIGKMDSSKFKRLSTPSYVTSVPGVPLHFYTQWVWYRQERDGTYTPFYPGTLQYTLEEKYLKGQHKYYFEFEELRLVVDTHGSPMVQQNLDTQRVTRIVRRPVFVDAEQSHPPPMSALLLSNIPDPFPHKVPDHWSSVDHFQDFEVVELRSDKTEFIDVHQRFFSTMDIKQHKIAHILRVQNPGLWDKYCSARRAMTPRGQRPEDVEERQLFHGTPTLLSARGICANSFDFRRAGENVGAIYGRGAYFSTTAHYSHSYTCPHASVNGELLRFMFLGRILVGQYTLGHPSYSKPPERDRLKLYDSCVNDMTTPTIFVIFDLAQSYPEYLIQYTDASVVGDTHTRQSQQTQAPPPPPLPPPPPPTAAASHQLSAAQQVSTSGIVNRTSSAAAHRFPASGAAQQASFPAYQRTTSGAVPSASVAAHQPSPAPSQSFASTDIQTASLAASQASLSRVTQRVSRAAYQPSRSAPMQHVSYSLSSQTHRCARPDVPLPLPVTQVTDDDETTDDDDGGDLSGLYRHRSGHLQLHTHFPTTASSARLRQSPSPDPPAKNKPPRSCIIS